MADVVAPTNADGDRIGSVWNPDFTVTTPESFNSPTQQYVRPATARAFDPVRRRRIPVGHRDRPAGDAHERQHALSLCPLLTQGCDRA